MELPLVIGVEGNRIEWVLNIKTSLYGLKQLSENWFDLLKNGIESRCNHQYQFEPCVLYRKYSYILTYVEIFFKVSHKKETITSLIESLKNGTENYCFTYEVYISNYPGVNTKKNQMGH